MKRLKRIFLLPLGLLKKILEIANQGARDFENKLRFPNAIIDVGSSFTLDSKVGTNSHILSGAIVNHSDIGSYSYCGRNALIQNTSIGKFCSIANDVLIGLGKHPIDLFSTSPIFYKNKNTLRISFVERDLPFSEYEKIIIGHDVWIGARAIVMDGITIGNGAIIATGAIVTKDVPPYAIVGGIPSKILRYRFDEKKIEKLLYSKWWEKDLTEIKKNINILNNI